jgi:S-adenosylmethionine:tRNA ribosyltransferase-isomerase
MNISEFDYNLPPELIAQHPADRRAESRMLVMNRDTGNCELRRFTDFPEFINADDCLVINNTRVIPSRLFGHRTETGGKVEILLLEEVGIGCWTALMKPGRRMHEGDSVTIDGNAPTRVKVVGRTEDGKAFRLRFNTENVLDMLEKNGAIPLPPYIQRQDTPEDRDRYQTVYAREPGAVAAPTAGLHFTPEILDKLRARGVSIAEITLHVGPGTFRPVQAERIEDHQMHEERYRLSTTAARTINRCRQRGGRVIAIGTTSVRVLETCATDQRTVTPGNGRTRIFLHPPKTPKVCDGLLTNFHLPRSTLLMLVSTFTSVEDVKAAYELAIKNQFRFYSYGDCMLLLPSWSSGKFAAQKVAVNIATGEGTPTGIKP